MAVLERNRVDFLPKAVLAEVVVSERLRQLTGVTGQTAEKAALQEALHNLRVLLDQEASLGTLPLAS